MEKLLSFVLSLLPVIIIGRYIYEKDKNKEPKTLLLKLFLSGILCFFLVTAITELFKDEISIFRLPITEMSEWQLILHSLIVIAFIQEICKWIMIYFISFNHKEFDEMYDIVVYSVFVSLGFVCIDNLYYLFSTDSFNLFKVVVNVPVNACLGIIMAYYLGIAKSSIIDKEKAKSNVNFVFSLLIPIIIHSIFTYLLLTDHPLIVLIVLVISYPIYILVIKKLKKMGRKSFRLLFKRK